MRRALLLGGLLALGACGRCGRPAPLPDAGVSAAGTPDAGRALLPGTDLRSALLVVFPEFRGVREVQGQATYQRTLALTRPLPEVVARLQQQLTSEGFTPLPPEDAALRMERAPYRVEAREAPGGLLLQVQLPITQQDVGRLLYARSSPTTQDFAALLPTLPGTRPTEAHFALVLVWRATDAALARLLVDKQSGALLKAGWEVVERREAPDGGPGGDVLRVRRAGGQGTVSYERQEDSARVRYEEPLAP